MALEERMTKEKKKLLINKKADKIINKRTP